MNEINFVLSPVSQGELVVIDQIYTDGQGLPGVLDEYDRMVIRTKSGSMSSEPAAIQAALRELGITNDHISLGTRLQTLRTYTRCATSLWQEPHKPWDCKGLLHDLGDDIIRSGASTIDPSFLTRLQKTAATYLYEETFAKFVRLSKLPIRFGFYYDPFNAGVEPESIIGDIEYFAKVAGIKLPATRLAQLRKHSLAIYLGKVDYLKSKLETPLDPDDAPWHAKQLKEEIESAGHDVERMATKAGITVNVEQLKKKLFRELYKETCTSIQEMASCGELGSVEDNITNARYYAVKGGFKPGEKWFQSMQVLAKQEQAKPTEGRCKIGPHIPEFPSFPPRTHWD